MLWSCVVALQLVAAAAASHSFDLRLLELDQLTPTERLQVANDDSIKAHVSRGVRGSAGLKTHQDTLVTASEKEGWFARLHTFVLPLMQHAGAAVGQITAGLKLRQRFALWTEQPSGEEEKGITPGIGTELERLAYSSVFLVLIIVTAIIFRFTKVYPAIDPNTIGRSDDTFQNEFNFKLFDCFSDWQICLWSFFCPAIRWAENMDMLDLYLFWVALVLFIALFVLTFILDSWLPMVIVWALIFGGRRSVKYKFSIIMPWRPGGDSLLGGLLDGCIMCWCCCCAIAQEARQIEAAAAGGYSKIKVIDHGEPQLPADPYERWLQRARQDPDA